jgi:hypothetical protein
VIEANAVAEIATITTHVAGGLALMPSQLRKTSIDALVRALMEPVQGAEDQAFPLTSQTIDEAETHALTGIGELVGLRRLNATAITDARYRVALKAWIRAMRSNGSIGDVEAVMTTLAGSASSSSWSAVECFPAGMLVTPAAALLTDEAYVGAIVRAVRAGGVRLQCITPSSFEGFRFGTDDEEPEASASAGFSNAAQTTGGYLAGVVE